MDDEELTARLDHLQVDLHEVAKLVHEMYAVLDEFRPLLAVFKPGSGASDVQKAGVLRALRKAAKGG